MSIKKMSPEDMITRARIKLLGDNPFFAILSLRLTPKAKEDLPTLAVDFKGNLFYNPKFIEGKSDEEMKFLISHEIMHVAFCHNIRFPFPIMDAGYKPNPEMKSKWDLWNIAGDVNINDILGESGFVIPDYVYSSNMENMKKYKNLSTEEIYSDLYENADRIGLQGSGCGGMIPGEHGGEQIEKEMEEWNKEIIRAANEAKKQGKLPAGIQSLVDMIIKPQKVNWEQRLWRYMQKLLPSGYTWLRPSKKYISLGYYLPSIVNKNIDVHIALDVSGSINDDQYVDFMNNVRYIASSFHNFKFTILSCDAEVKGEPLVSFDIGEVLSKLKERKGYGGTDFRPVFKWMNENAQNAKLLIYFTDSEGTYPDIRDVGNYDTLWVFSRSGENVPPFGDMIRIE